MGRADADAPLARITPVADHAAFGPAELVIEAATEREEVKRAIFASVGQHLSDTAILATNTSSRSEEHTSELQSLMRSSYAVFCLKKKNTTTNTSTITATTTLKH